MPLVPHASQYKSPGGNSVSLARPFIINIEERGEGDTVPFIEKNRIKQNGIGREEKNTSLYPESQPTENRIKAK